MTSLTIHTPVPAAANAVLTMPANVNYGKKTNTGNNYISYSSAPKNWFQEIFCPGVYVRLGTEHERTGV